MDGWIGRAAVERGRETEGRPFSWLTRGERGSLMSLSRGAAGLEHYIRSFIRDELQLPLLFTRDEIEFYTVGIPSSPEGEYFTMINDLCRQHAPFFSPLPSPRPFFFITYAILENKEMDTRRRRPGNQSFFISLSFPFFSFANSSQPSIMLMKPNPRPPPRLYCSSANRSRGNNIVPRLIDPASDPR